MNYTVIGKNVKELCQKRPLVCVWYIAGTLFFKPVAYEHKFVTTKEGNQVPINGPPTTDP